MSVLIKGMDKPKSCFDFRLKDDRGQVCLVMWKVAPFMRPEDCPLAEVPTPHGRLIDADKLLESGADVCEDYVDSDGYCWNSEWGYSREKIVAAPTIIEAEGKP